VKAQDAGLKVRIRGSRSAARQTQRKNMNWDRIEGNWKQFSGSAKERWGKLTDDQLKATAGKREQLGGKLQEVYGISREEADKQMTAWERMQQEKPSPAA
jgi:uncharacterized protein YjbJ (UPF0337 family)